MVDSADWPLWLIKAFRCRRRLYRPLSSGPHHGKPQNLTIHYDHVTGRQSLVRIRLISKPFAQVHQRRQQSSCCLNRTVVPITLLLQSKTCIRKCALQKPCSTKVRIEAFPPIRSIRWKSCFSFRKAFSKVFFIKILIYPTIIRPLNGSWIATGALAKGWMLARSGEISKILRFGNLETWKVNVYIFSPADLSHCAKKVNSRWGNEVRSDEMHNVTRIMSVTLCHIMLHYVTALIANPLIELRDL